MLIVENSIPTLQLEMENSDNFQEPSISAPSSPCKLERENLISDCPPPKNQITSDAGPSVQLNEKKRPLWARHTMQDAEKISAPHTTFRESERPQRLDGYVALMCELIDSIMCELIVSM